MQFTDQGYVLSVRRHAETSGIVKLLSREHGMVAGAVRGVGGKNARGLWQPGNRVIFTWNARLAEHLGSLAGELAEPVAAHAMRDAGALSALSSALAMTERLMPEHEPHRALFSAIEALMESILAGGQWQEPYCRFELALLSECGFRLDLAHCAATGATEDLIYVSPKSGRAVSRSAGEPYKDKLLPLPAFLTSSPLTSLTNTSLTSSLRLTGYFLEHWVFAPHGWRLPPARERLTQQLGKMSCL